MYGTSLTIEGETAAGTSYDERGSGNERIGYVAMANDNVELLRLGRRIQTKRRILGFSQGGFAKDCGLNRSYFGGIERGERDLTFAVLCRICHGLHCDIAKVTRGIPRTSYVRPS
jgi:hypothetical protein